MDSDHAVEDPSFTRTLKGHEGNLPGQGPFLRVTLEVEGVTICEASYETYLCPGCQACGKALVSLVRGRTLKEAEEVTYEAIVQAVGPLERRRRICYSLAALALVDALRGAVPS